MGTQSYYLVFLPSFGEPSLSISFPSDRPFSLPRDPSPVATSHISRIAQGRSNEYGGHTNITDPLSVVASASEQMLEENEFYVQLQYISTKQKDEISALQQEISNMRKEHKLLKERNDTYREIIERSIAKKSQPGPKKRKNVRGQGNRYTQTTTISMLPDNVLLEIFDFCRKDSIYCNNVNHALWIWHWHPLVHVCQRWRQIVFTSPHRLDLRIVCTPRTPVRENLGIWPALPIVILHWNSYYGWWHGNNDDNVIAGLEHPDRVYVVRLSDKGSKLEKITTVMKEPFPVLTKLDITSEDGNHAVLPAEFLGGSVPCLQEIHLRGIPFPALPRLLLSASDLFSLSLENIPATGYISPEAMVVGLAALPRLRSFTIGFRSATPRPGRIHLSSITRTVLPALMYFGFKGASEYLEELVARIDAPQLIYIYTTYLNQHVDFHVAQLSNFIDRSVGPKLTLFRHVHVAFDNYQVTFHTYRDANDPYSDLASSNHTTISCEGIDWQVSHIAQVLSHFSTILSTVAHLGLELGDRFKENKLEEGHQLEGTDDVEWLHFFRQFSAVQTLRVSQELAGHVALALEDIAGSMVAEVLPSLDLIYLENQPASSVEKFVAGRQLSDHPVTVVDTQMEFDEKVESYVSK